MKTFCLAALVGTTAATTTVRRALTAAELATATCTRGMGTVTMDVSSTQWDFHGIPTDAANSAAWYCDVTTSDDFTAVDASYRLTSVDPVTGAVQDPDDTSAMSSWGADTGNNHAGYFSFGTPTTVLDAGGTRGGNLGYGTPGNQVQLNWQGGNVAQTNVVRFGFSQSANHEDFTIDNLVINIEAIPTTTTTTTTTTAPDTNSYFNAGDAPACSISDGHLKVNYLSTMHPSFKCHRTGNSCACQSNHPTHHTGLCKQFTHEDGSADINIEGDCTATGINSVDGQWSSYGGWSTCTTTCGPGTKSRTRTCDGIVNGGQDCSGLDGGSATETVNCGNQACPLASCEALYESGVTSSGVYTINPGSCSGDTQVYCDMSNGGGWAMVATIDGNDQDHSNIHAVGATLITPSTSTTSKYSDAKIQCIQNAATVSTAGTRFVCRGKTQFFKGCSFSSVDGIGDKETRNDINCVTSFNDQAATSLRATDGCNKGSEGVGAHCHAGNHDNMDSYCSHCKNGEKTIGTQLGGGIWNNHNRMGCGHDTHGYGHAGALYVRGKASPAYSSCKAAYDAGKTTSGVYTINTSCAGEMHVYCDMSNGGGWAMVATIDGNDQDHSNIHAVGATLITPSTSTTSKYSDAKIQCIQNAATVSTAGTRFVCRGKTQFFKGCSFSSVDGIGDKETRNDINCVTSFNDQAATSLRATDGCNKGSEGVGAHCHAGNHDNMDSYCSHCKNGEKTIGTQLGGGIWNNHNRMGCGHDTHGYGHSGALYVR